MASLRPDAGRRYIVHLAPELEALGTVGGPDGIYYIIEVLVRLLYRVAEGSVLVGSNAATDSQVQTPSLQQDVEHGYLVG